MANSSPTPARLEAILDISVAHIAECDAKVDEQKAIEAGLNEQTESLLRKHFLARACPRMMTVEKSCFGNKAHGWIKRHG